MLKCIYTHMEPLNLATNFYPVVRIRRYIKLEFPLIWRSDQIFNDLGQFKIGQNLDGHCSTRHGPWIMVELFSCLKCLLILIKFVTGRGPICYKISLLHTHTHTTCMDLNYCKTTLTHQHIFRFFAISYSLILVYCISFSSFVKNLNQELIYEVSARFKNHNHLEDSENT
jgi:hypothetical protein